MLCNLEEKIILVPLFWKHSALAVVVICHRLLTVKFAIHLHSKRVTGGLRLGKRDYAGRESLLMVGTLSDKAALSLEPEQETHKQETHNSVVRLSWLSM